MHGNHFPAIAVLTTCGRKWAEEPEQWTGNRLFIFLLPSFFASHSFRASCKILRSLRLAHKAPQLCRLTCPRLKFCFVLFCFVFFFSRKFEFVGTFQTSSRDGQEKKNNNVVVP